MYEPNHHNDDSFRSAIADEKAELWSSIANEADGYAAYKEKADRDIPIVICEPAT